jgi:hypothetical protein
MQQYSAAAAFFKRATIADPKFEKKINSLYKFENDQVGVLSALNKAQQSAAGEWKAFITSGVDTTARNAIGTAIVLPLKSGVQLMEGTAYSIGKALRASSGTRVDTFKRSMGDTVHDAFDVYSYMFNFSKDAARGPTVAREAVDSILKGNATLRDNINNALQETGDRKVSDVARWANSMNVAMDSFVRRAVFTSSVERELRRQGKDLYLDFLDKNIDIPTPIIKTAMKDALQTTFAYVPKAKDPMVASSVERGVGTAASYVIKVIDQSPLAFVIPFPRYMANSMAYFYRYSPLGAVGARQELGAATRLLEEAANMRIKPSGSELLEAKEAAIKDAALQEKAAEMEKITGGLGLSGMF